MDLSLPALSLRQPWAWAILSCGKNIENRSWGTGYRGRIVLHASKTWDADGERWLIEHGHLETPNERVSRVAGQLGAFVGEVDVTDCVQVFPSLSHSNPWAFGPFCWVLANPAQYEKPIPGRGYPGLFRITEESPGANRTVFRR